MSAAFFYGILMHPMVLRRALGHEGNDLRICSAILLDHTRHRVENEDYPGMLPYTRSSAMFDRDLSFEDKSVRGTVVTGLSEYDMKLLDLFEASDYNRQRVTVYLLSTFTSLSSFISSEGVVPPPLPSKVELTSNEFDCETYIWVAPLSGLVAELWSYAEFVQKDAWKWIGQEASLS